MVELTEKDGAVTFRVRVQPRAGRSGFGGEIAGAVKIRASAPPVDGAANDECRRLLAKALGIGVRSVKIVSGLASRDKVIRVEGLSVTRVREAIDRLMI